MIMLRYVLIRLATMFGVLAAALLITIVLVGSGMDIILERGVEHQIRTEIATDPSIVGSFSSPAELDAYIVSRIDLRTLELGLDKPWWSAERIAQSMYKILTLDFGRATFLSSDTGSSDVADILAERLPKTILLFTTATVIILLIGVLLGAIASSRAGSMVDRITSAFAIISSSFPVWWVGLLMIFAFSFAWSIFPSRATPDVDADDPAYIGSLLYHMTLPLLTIVLIGFGSWSYLVRNFMVGVLQEDFIAAKRAIGIRPRKIIYSHALRNAAPPIVTVMALSLSGSLGGAIITEAVFNWPGMGRLYFEAVTVMDLPVIIGATYVLTVFFLASVFIADMLYVHFDPRTKTQ